MHDDGSMSEAGLPRPLRDAVAALRDGDAVSDLWRARVLQDVSRASAARRRRGRLMRVAAAVLVAVTGAMLIRTRGPAVSDIASVARPVTPAAARVDAEPVRFTLDAASAHRVALVGDFDGWAREGRPMRRSADGRTWEVDVVLPPGRHAFAYVVDGVMRAAPGAARAVDDDFGVPSSVVVVASRGI